MMATRDEKTSKSEPSAPVDVPAPPLSRPIPRLETASEMRGFPISPNGTALGVGRTPPSPNEEILEGARFETSAEEAAEMDRLLRQVDDHINRMAPRARTKRVDQRLEPVVQPSPPSSPVLPVEAKRDIDTIPPRGRDWNGSRRAALPFESDGVPWKWLALGCLLGLVLTFVLVTRPFSTTTAPQGPTEHRVSVDATPEAASRGSAVEAVRTEVPPQDAGALSPVGEQPASRPVSSSQAPHSPGQGYVPGYRLNTE